VETVIRNFYKLFFVLLLVVISFPINGDTIIDSVYSVGVLDGMILYTPEGEPELMNNFTYEMKAGDSGVPLIPGPPPNSCNRSFVSFELPIIPENCEIDSIYIRLYQFRAFGNGSEQGGIGFPIWDVTNGDTIKCIMSHIDYGFELDYDDWYIGDIGHPNTYAHNIGTITDNGIEGYRYLNMTEYVMKDYEDGRILSQYRIAFETNTDGDSLRDAVGFTTFESNIDLYQPKMYFYMTQETDVGNETVEDTGLKFSINPNPVVGKGNIYFSSTKPGYAQINVYNVKGQLIKAVFDGNIDRGENKIIFDIDRLSTGIYFVKIQTQNNQIIKNISIIH